jgi:hypothetical protein
LPRRSKVVDLLENRTIAERATEFPLTLAPNRTVLLGIEY